MMDRDAIERLIPHREPFLLLDRIEELQPGVTCVAWMSVEAQDPVFRGHFPGRPILPGVLIIEAVAQTAAVMMAASGSGTAAGEVLLGSVNRFKFLKPVRPGMQVRIETSVLTQAGAMVLVGGTASVDGETVASGELSVVTR